MDSFSLSSRASMTQYIVWTCELITMSLNMDHKESNAQVVGPRENESALVQFSLGHAKE